MKTRLSEDLSNADNKVQYNTHCKKMLGNRQVIVRILKDTVEEFRDCSLAEIDACLEGEPEVAVIPVLPGENVRVRKSEYIHGEQNVDAVPGEGEFTYDVRLRARVPGQNESVMLYLNLEGQKKFNPGYPLIKRGIFYCSRMVSSQYGIEFTGDDYSGMQKVYSIWICMNVPEYRANSIISYVTEPRVIAGEPKCTDKKENYDIINVIQICLGEESPEISLLQMLRVLFSEKMKIESKKKILTEQYGMKMETGDGKEEIEYMCNFADIIEEQAIERGMKKGIEQGIEQGISVLIKTLKEIGITREDILYKIKSNFNISEEQAENYMQKYL